MQKYYLQNLDCADCAQRLEEAINKLSCVQHAQISFSTNMLFLQTNDLEKVKSTISEIEPKVFLTQTKASDQKVSLKPIIAILVVFFIGLGLSHFSSYQPLKIFSYILLAGVYLYSGRDVFLGAWRNFKKGQIFDENVLMLSATIASFCIGAYEEAVSVMVFFTLGEFFQELALNKSKNSIQSLLDVAPNIAYLKKDNEIIPTTPEELKIDDVFIVKAGEKIPTDGVVLKGESTLDQKALTGESIPITAQVGQKVLGGSINLSGVLEIKVSKTYENSSVAKIIELIQNASNKKSPTEKFITKFAKYYTPIVFFVAILVALIPPSLDLGTFDEWIYRGLVVLMVSCPCALVISIPLGYFGGIGAASKKGILIKGADTLEALTHLKNIAFDKTGTLTKGVFKVIKIVPQDGFTQEDVLRYADCSQNLSNHPIASSIKEAYKNHHKHHLEEYEEISGYGTKAKCYDDFIIAGNDKLLHKFNIPHPQSECVVQGTVVHIATNGSYVGHIIISDTLKDDALEAIDSLKKQGINNICILSGDNEYATAQIANQLGCEYYANLLPEEKLKQFEIFKNTFEGKTAFVGDGINDAPTLASADISISLGGASDLSKENADMIITNNSIVGISQALKIAHKTKTIIWQNIVFALGVKGIFIILGLFGVASLWEAVFGDVGVALIALANAMRAMR